MIFIANDVSVGFVAEFAGIALIAPLTQGYFYELAIGSPLFDWVATVPTDYQAAELRDC
jgi:hypothetical protein